ncbi:MAG: hypothetical protein IBX55_12785, partial [Methyloprofundus sp.]|nr:hypothetical protein [Methyloprofundus sp.]
MELNAPIPKYANLRFLLYRWGFHHVDEGGYTAFKDALDSYTLHDGLVVYLSKPRPWVEYDGDEDWLTEGVAYSLDELNKEGAVTHNILMFGSYKPVKLSFFYLDSKGASHLVPHSDKKQNTSFLSYENIKNKPGDQGDKQAWTVNPFSYKKTPIFYLVP